MTKHSIGVIGASGFIGNRIVEILHLGGQHDVRPVVRRASGLALASRFGIKGRIADALDPVALGDALKGCDIVVHALAGNAQAVICAVPALYQAAEQAGCKRIVYLSSAMVHGQIPPEDCDETSPLPNRQPLPYNNAKVIAERQLFNLCRSGPVGAVALRPGIVYGPRSQWIGGLADSMLSGEAYLVDGGAGLCNAIYVDNVVDAVIRCFDAIGVDGEAFLLGEHEILTWRGFYARLAEALGVDLASVPSVEFEDRGKRFKERLDMLRRSAPVRAALGALPAPLSRGLAAFWEASGFMPASPAALQRPQPTLEMALLHRSQHVPSWAKARKMLGYEPPVPAKEAWRRTMSWLTFAGYSCKETAHD